MRTLDTSVILKWTFTWEEDADKALLLRQQHVDGIEPIVIPSFGLYEAASVFKHSQNALSEAQVTSAIRSLMHVHLRIVRVSRRLLTRAVQIAFVCPGLVVYDAFFLAVAELHNCPYITADKKAYDKIKHLPYVNWLRNYSI